MSFTETRRTSSSDFIPPSSSNSSFASSLKLPFKTQPSLRVSNDHQLSSRANILNVQPLQSHSVSAQNNKKLHISKSQQIQEEFVQKQQQANKLVETEKVFLKRAKKSSSSSSLVTSLNDNNMIIPLNAHEMRGGSLQNTNSNGFIVNRGGIRKGLVTSSLLVGIVQRKDVDTVYACLASNSNMTQASRASVKLEMNRKLHVSIFSQAGLRSIISPLQLWPLILLPLSSIIYLLALLYANCQIKFLHEFAQLQ